MKSSFLVWGPRWGFVGFYFRIFGYGLSFKRDERRGFAERYGLRRVLRIGRWAIQWLKASDLPKWAF